MNDCYNLTTYSCIKSIDTRFKNIKKFSWSLPKPPNEKTLNNKFARENVLLKQLIQLSKNVKYFNAMESMNIGFYDIDSIILHNVLIAMNKKHLKLKCIIIGSSGSLSSVQPTPRVFEIVCHSKFGNNKGKGKGKGKEKSKGNKTKTKKIENSITKSQTQNSINIKNKKVDYINLEMLQLSKMVLNDIFFQSNAKLHTLRIHFCKLNQEFWIQLAETSNYLLNNVIDLEISHSHTKQNGARGTPINVARLQNELLPKIGQKLLQVENFKFFGVVQLHTVYIWKIY